MTLAAIPVMELQPLIVLLVQQMTFYIKMNLEHPVFLYVILQINNIFKEAIAKIAIRLA